MMDTISMDGMGLEKPLTVFKNIKNIKKKKAYPYILISREVGDLLDSKDNTDINTEQIENIVKSILLKEAYDYSMAKGSSDKNLEKQGQNNTTDIKSILLTLSDIPYFMTKYGESLTGDNKNLTGTDSEGVGNPFIDIADGINAGMESIRYDNNPPKIFKDKVAKDLRLDDPDEKGGKFLALKGKKQAENDENSIIHNTYTLGADIENNSEPKKKVKSLNIAVENIYYKFKCVNSNFNDSKTNLVNLIPEKVKINETIFEMVDMMDNKIELKWNGNKDGNFTVLSEQNDTLFDRFDRKTKKLF